METKAYLTYCVIGVLAVCARLLVALEKITVYQFLRTVVTGAFLGLVFGLGLMEDTTLSPWLKYMIFGIAVSLSEDICMGLIEVGKRLRKDPLYLWKLFRGIK